MLAAGATADSTPNVPEWFVVGARVPSGLGPRVEACALCRPKPLLAAGGAAPPLAQAAAAAAAAVAAEAAATMPVAETAAKPAVRVAKLPDRSTSGDG